MRDRNVFLTRDGLAALLSRERQAERERIARILHDHFLQQCHAILLALESDRLDPIALAAEKRAALALGRELIVELRQANGAGPFGARVVALARRLCEQAGIHFDCALSDRLFARSDPFADALYMCVAEALRNAVRHASAGTVRVGDTWSSGQMVVSVTDDGIGMPAAVLHDAGVDRHFGLAGMRERIAAIGGVLNIGRREGGGTVVAFRFDRDEGRDAWRDDASAARRHRP